MLRSSCVARAWTEKEGAFQKSSWPKRVGFRGDFIVGLRKYVGFHGNFMGIVFLNMVYVYIKQSQRLNWGKIDRTLGFKKQRWGLFDRFGKPSPSHG